MALDIVHDTQAVFRTILDCMSRPGTIQNISQIGEPSIENGACSQSVFVTAMTVLDAEVRFCVIGDHTQEIEGYLSAMTFSKAAAIADADYIFLMKDASPKKIKEVFQAAKKGTFENPDHSATIVMETGGLSNEKLLALTGPGIQETATVEIKGSESWIKARKQANDEFPLGIDMILTDQNNNLMCLPRTTNIQNSEVQKWHM